jgi:hypothetical protein
MLRIGVPAANWPRKETTTRFLDSILELQLAPLQFGQSEIVRSGMGEFFFKFALQSPVQLLEFGKIRLNGHG